MVKQLCEQLESTEIKTVELIERNYATLKIFKDEIIELTSCRKLDLKQKLAKVRIMCRGLTLGFNAEPTCWLRVYFDPEL